MLVLKELEDVMDCRRNFGNYRLLLKQNDLPVLPYFGVFLRDFTFIDVGNEDYIEEDIVNYEKMQLIAEIVTSVKAFQNTQYYFPASGELHNYLQNISAFDEATLHKFSLGCESPSEI
jgi:hypothetical protein